MTEDIQYTPQSEIITPFRRSNNVQKGNPTVVDAVREYRKGLEENSQHKINGQDYSANGMNRVEFYDSIQDSISEYNQSDIYPTIEKVLKFTANNSEVYCGIKPENFYANEKELEFTINGAAQELTIMISSLIRNDYQGIDFPSQLKEIFKGIKQPTLDDILKGTRSGIKIAEKCHACEQVDPMVGAMIHTSSTILARVTPWETSFADFWEENYSNCIFELSNFKKTGIVDALIVMTENNKEKFPKLDKFFGSHLELPESNFSGTYYDMVNMPQYK